jgi:hypothetical protein
MGDAENKMSSRTTSEMLMRLKENVVIFEGLAVQYGNFGDTAITLRGALAHNKEIIKQAEAELFKG